MEERYLKFDHRSKSKSVGREFAGINIKRHKGMKLAEALSIRKDLQKRIEQIRNLLTRAVSQEKASIGTPRN